MISKSRIQKMLKLAKEKAESHIGRLFSEAFMQAHSRGKVLCRDGKEKLIQEWVDGLDPDTASRLKEITGQAEK